MKRLNDRFSGVLVLLPWQLLTTLAALVFVALHALPALVTPSAPAVSGLAQAAPTLAPWAAGALLVLATASYLRRRSRSRLLDAQTGIDSIRRLSWQQFEQLVSEYYRRQGYTVQETGQHGSDGGVDLRLRRDRELVLVQCKQWKAWKVGVSVVREMLGSMMAEDADRGVVVTSGRFTNGARELARTSRVGLVDGARLVEMIGQLRGDDRMASERHPMAAVALRQRRERWTRRALFWVGAKLALPVLAVVLSYGLWTVAVDQLRNIGATAVRASATVPQPERPHASPSERTPLANGVYRWRDATGQTVYGDRPPAGVDAVPVEGNLSEQNVIQALR